MMRGLCAGRVAQNFDEGKDKSEREYTVACTSPSGLCLAVGSFDKCDMIVRVVMCGDVMICQDSPV